MAPTQDTEHVETVIVGGGQAGLAVGYHLTKRGRSCLILDASDRIGDSWRKRWPSLRLYSPARAAALPGLPFPAPSHSFPSGRDMADYLEAYAREFALPVRTGIAVDGWNGTGTATPSWPVSAGSRRTTWSWQPASSNTATR